MKALACLFAATLLLASRSFIGYSETSSGRLSNVDSQRN